MSDPVDRAFQELRREYLSTMPARLNELRDDIASLRAGHRDAADSLRVRLHRLAGSAGSYGFRDLSMLAREGEQRLSRSPEPDWLEEMVNRMERAASDA